MHQENFLQCITWKGEVIFSGFMSQIPKTIYRQALQWSATALLGRHTTGIQVVKSLAFKTSRCLIPRTLDFSELMPEQPHVEVGKRHSLGLRLLVICSQITQNSKVSVQIHPALISKSETRVWWAVFTAGSEWTIKTKHLSNHKV